jgi:chromosomal replication initiator protein
LTPIVFSGPTGTGKTSLAMALISKLMVAVENRSGGRLLPFSDASLGKVEPSDLDTKPVYLTGSEFVRRYYAAIDTDTVDEFRQSILQSTALLLDNVQQIANKIPAQRELESLLDQAIKLHLPVFVICNTPPAAIEGFSQRLVSRLASGLTVPFHPPGAEARSCITRKLAEIHQVQLTENALDQLNNQFEVTVPRLEHLFGQIKLKQRIAQEDGDVLCNNMMDVALLQKILAPRDEDLVKMIRLIQKRVANKYELNLSDLKGNSRKQTIVLARGVAIYLTRALLGCSFLKIGNAFGKRDHSTILHSFRKIESAYQLRKTNPEDLTTEQKKTNGLIDCLKQELTDLFATQIGID